MLELWLFCELLPLREPLLLPEDDEPPEEALPEELDWLEAEPLALDVFPPPEDAGIAGIPGMFTAPEGKAGMAADPGTLVPPVEEVELLVLCEPAWAGATGCPG